MTVVAVVQARLGGLRLPGKVLLPLAGKPMLTRIVERIRRSRWIDGVVVAIGGPDPGEAIGDAARDGGASVCYGSELDVLGRTLEAARLMEAHWVVRIPADNPVPDWVEIDRMVSAMMEEGQYFPDFGTNLRPLPGSPYVDGIGAEVIRVEALADMTRNATSDREHIANNFVRYGLDAGEHWPGVWTVPCPKALRRPELALDIDTRAQYDRFAALYDDLYELPTPGVHEWKAPGMFLTEDVLRWWDAHPYA